MKNLLVLAALTMAVSPAFASKARYGALGNSYHITDTQSIFLNPAHMHKVGQFATFELGQPNNSTANATPYNEKAEGGFLMSSSWGMWGAYVGHRSETVTEFIAGINQQAASGTPASNAFLLGEQNPLDLMFGGDMGAMKWGAYLHYSSGKNDDMLTAAAGNQEAKTNTAGAGFGIAGDVWDAYLRVGLNGKATGMGSTPIATTTELEQKGLYSIGGGYWMENNYVFANFLTAKGEVSNTAVAGKTDLEKTEYQVGVVNNNPVAGGNVFYGVSYLNNEVKNGANKSTKARLPVVIGMEVDAASWLVLRGSVTQSVLLGENKNLAGQKSEMVDTTTVAAGAGIKFGKLTLDGLISHTPNTTNSAATGTESNIPSTNGTISGTGTITQASLTYAF